ncbi:MAG: hypothetical protein DRJ42_31475 [Deltaproteobacteria bacterium]|nr:MAG: hypothetical protein DRJ42_31475 [Deltaproteobacteria bacterium]
MIMTRKIAFLLFTSILFWGPAFAVAQSTDTAGFDPTPRRAASTDDSENRETQDVDGSQPAGTIGLGADGLLSGLAGIQARVQLTDGIGLQLAMRFGVAELAENDTRIGMSLSGIFEVFGFEGGHLSIVGGFDWEYGELTDPTMTTASAWEIGFGGGIFAEIFPAQFFSIHAQAGARMAFGDHAGNDGVDLAIGGDAYAGFGFTFWFV